MALNLDQLERVSEKVDHQVKQQGTSNRVMRIKNKDKQ